ncbi:MAG: nuclear transport factor 2 family protein [Bacteroidetes bacterium]|nr:nuclear transport factor 2 family protein [Bacteroidota bacterium]
MIYTLKNNEMNYLKKPGLVIFVLFCLLIASSTYSQTGKSDKKQESDAAFKKEISATLDLWNNLAKSRDVSHFMDLFDNNAAIMAIGSDSGEVFKGREQIEGWMKTLFAHRSFSWEMKRVDIDHNGNTAWVFMDGYMIVTNDKGKTVKFPYRFTGILVKVKNTWKWRHFDGAVPGGH